MLRALVLRLIIVLRTGSDFSGFGGGVLDTLRFICISLFILRFLFILTITQAERVVFSYGRRLDSGQGLPFAGLVASGRCTLGGF